MKRQPTRCGNTDFRWGERTYVMGILNLSPDSFSGDGVTGVEAAIARARHLADEGADIIDVGGQSTRPGFKPIAAEEEMRRVVPVIERLATEVTVPVSVDTSRSEVAARAVAAGAALINDQWGLKADPSLAVLAAKARIPLVLMSNQRDRGGYDAGAQRDTADYADVIGVVRASLAGSIATALESGVARENIILDPGIGFGKTWRQDIELIRRLEELQDLGCPILLGTSRKSLIKMVLKLPAEERLEGTAATVALGIAHGADMVRVHDVRAMTRVCRMSDAIVRA